MHFEEKDFKKVIIKQETVCQNKMKRMSVKLKGKKNEDHFVTRGFKHIALRLRLETGTPRGWVVGPPMIEILWPGPAPLCRRGRSAGALRAAVCCLPPAPRICTGTWRKRWQEAARPQRQHRLCFLHVPEYSAAYNLKLIREKSQPTIKRSPDKEPSCLPYPDF